MEPVQKMPEQKIHDAQSGLKPDDIKKTTENRIFEEEEFVNTASSLESLEKNNTLFEKALSAMSTVVRVGALGFAGFACLAVGLTIGLPFTAVGSLIAYKGFRLMADSDKTTKHKGILDELVSKTIGGAVLMSIGCVIAFPTAVGISCLAKAVGFNRSK